MDKRYGILIISVTILVLCFAGTASATNWSVDDSGGADFTGIQEAINNASAGDTILVYSGVYYENVVVNKSVTLKGINLPVVDADGNGSAITLTGDGIKLQGFTATNSVSWWSGVGIKVTSNNNTITGNNVSSNWGGIRLYDSSNNTITGNNVSNNYDGISLYDSSNNTITGNNVNNNRGGILLDDSSNNTITGNNVNNNNNWGGIRLYDSSNNNTITGNVFVNDGLSVYSSYQNTVEDNTVNGKPLVYLEDVSNYKVEDAGQVIIVNCNNITIENLDLSNTSGGIALWKTENSKISNNTVCNNNWGSGILLYYSSNNSITGNNVNNNRGGIRLRESNNNTITGNVFVNDGLSVYSSYQNTVEGNTVNGKSLVYLEDVSDYKVEDAGQVILVNCDNITVENLELSNTSTGIELLETEDSKILNNTVSNNWAGINLYYSSNNNITGNNVSNNRVKGISLYYSSNNNITGNNACNNSAGIDLYDSSNNNITGNNACNNSAGIDLCDSSNNNITGNNACNNSAGISLYYSSNNNITGNNACNNSAGIDLYYDSSNNNIYLNNFINNADNVHSSSSTNIWNSPLEITYTYSGTAYTNYLGNYWHDYEGTDTDADGIGNTYYNIDSKKDENDVYPLMKPFENYIT